MKTKGKPAAFVLDSKRFLDAHKDDVAAALELLKAGTDHLPVTVVPSVSDAVGRGLCSIGASQSALAGNKSGVTASSKV